MIKINGNLIEACCLRLYNENIKTNLITLPKVTYQKSNRGSSDYVSISEFHFENGVQMIFEIYGYTLGEFCYWCGQKLFTETCLNCDLGQVMVRLQQISWPNIMNELIT